MYHHNVHASQLRPDLCKDTDMGSVDHVRLQKLEIRDIGIVALELAHLFDVLKFPRDPRTIGVAFAVNQCQDCVAVFPAVLASKPTGRFWEEKHAGKKNDGWNHLQSPWHTERFWSIKEGAAI